MVKLGSFSGYVMKEPEESVVLDYWCRYLINMIYLTLERNYCHILTYKKHNIMQVPMETPISAFSPKLTMD